MKDEIFLCSFLLQRFNLLKIFYTESQSKFTTKFMIMSLITVKGTFKTFGHNFFKLKSTFLCLFII